MTEGIFEHPDIVLLGGEQVLMDIKNAGETCQLCLLNDPNDGWIFGYRRFPRTKSNITPFTKCREVKLHDEIYNNGRLYMREFLVDADGMRLWGREKIYKDRVERERFTIQKYCQMNNVPFEYSSDIIPNKDQRIE